MDISDWTPSPGITLEANADLAIREVAHNVLVSAGPGAGKTEFLAQKASYLLNTPLCPDPYQILAISFKKDAAENLADRVKDRCGIDAKRFESCTFDAFAKGLLDRYLRALPERLQPSRDYCINEIQTIKDLTGYDNLHMLNTQLWQEVTRKGEGTLANRLLRPAVGPSQLTFPLITALVMQLLETNPQIANAIRATYRYVFVDEYQDTTDMQYTLLHYLFSNPATNNVTVVGDLKQRIMVWAGAKTDAFDSFSMQFNARIYELRSNFRASPPLIALQQRYSSLLNESTSVNALNSNITNDEIKESHAVEGTSFNDSTAEASYIANEILNEIKAGVQPEDIAILCRQNVGETTELIREQLGLNGIRVRLENEIQVLVDDDFINLLLGVLSTAVDSLDYSSAANLENNLSYLWGYEFDDEEAQSQSREYEEFTHRYNSLKKSIDKNIKIIKNLDDIDTIIYELIEQIGKQNIRRVYSRYQQPSHVARVMKKLLFELKRIYNSCALTASPQDRMQTAVDYLRGKNCIRVMTIHKSKGLEFDNVYVMGVDDEHFWSMRKGVQEKEEAISTFFVAISRPRKKLLISTSGHVKREPALSINLWKPLVEMGVVRRYA